MGSMKFTIVLVLVCVALVAAKDPPRPDIPDSFEAKVDIEIHTANGTAFGDGDFAIFVPGGKGVQFYSFDHSEFDVFELERYDIEKGFAIDSKNKSHCYEQGLTARCRTRSAGLPRPSTRVSAPTATLSTTSGSTRTWASSCALSSSRPTTPRRSFTNSRSPTATRPTSSSRSLRPRSPTTICSRSPPSRQVMRPSEDGSSDAPCQGEAAGEFVLDLGSDTGVVRDEPALCR